jgi:hypothetical protein
MLRRVPAAVLATACLLGFAHATEVQFPVGSSLGLAPPPGLQPDGITPGFRDTGHNVAMLLLELPPTAYEAALGSLTPEGAKQHGIIIDKRETLFTDAGAALLSIGEDTNEHSRKWMLLAQMPKFTALVTVDVPDAARKLYSDETIRTALTTLTLRPAPIQEQLGLLPYQLTEFAGFRVVAVVNRNTVVMTRGEEDNIHVAAQPHVIVSIGPMRGATSRDWPRLAELAFASLPGYVERRVTVAEPIRIDNAPGYEIRAEARDATTGAPVVMVQWLRFGSTAFVQILGITTKANWDRDFPQFRAVRDGIQPKKS